MNNGINGRHAGIISALQQAVHDASHDYVRWSKGFVLYKDGVEFLMQAYAGRAVFNAFQPRPTIRFERRIKDLNETMSGRIDMTIEFDDREVVAVEFKKYSSEGKIASDVERLTRLVREQKISGGMLVAPCYMKMSVDGGCDWPLREQKRYHLAGSVKWHLSHARELPLDNPVHEGWSHERALVIEV